MPKQRGPMGPSGMATKVRSELQKRKIDVDRAALRQVLTDLYSASFQTEEGNAIRVLLVLGDPAYLQGQLSESPPELQHQWRPWAIDPPLPFTTENLAKLARATDPRSSAIAVSITEGRPVIWGLVDQQDQVQAGVTWDEAARPPIRAGLLQVEVAGVAHLIVWHRYERLAELHGASLQPQALDVFDGGPVREALLPGFTRFCAEVANGLNVDVDEIKSALPQLSSIWFGEIRRLLLRLQAYGSGGTLVITPDTTYEDLEFRHRISYDRLRSALMARGVNALRVRKSAWAGGIPKAALYREREGIKRELDGANRFVSLLPRIDGAVVLTPDLDVVGFSVRIQKPPRPPAADGGLVPTAGNQGATLRAMKLTDYSLYGTRHQSAFRYVQHVDGAVVLLVSHDGSARAVRNHRGAATLWNGIMLMRETRPSRSPRKKTTGR